jgi:hypothetical protein
MPASVVIALMRGAELRLGHVVARHPFRPGAFFPPGDILDRGAFHIGLHAAQAKALAHQIVERRLIVRTGQPVARGPIAAAALLIDAGKARAGSGAPGRKAQWPHPGRRPFIHPGLILRRRDAVPRHPASGRALVENRGITLAAAVGVAINADRAKALLGQFIKARLVLRAGHSVIGGPRRASSLYPAGHEQFLCHRLPPLSVVTATRQPTCDLPSQGRSYHGFAPGIARKRQ